MSTTRHFLLLPPAIDYAGFTFHLRFTEHREYGLGIAYVLGGCHSRKKYKRLAWKQGYWEDRSPQRQISTMYSNYLFYEPLYDTSEPTLHYALQTLRQRMTDYQLLQASAYHQLRDMEIMVCQPIRLLEAE